MSSEKMGGNIKHECAHYAYKCIDDVLGTIKDSQRDYRSEVRSTATRIHDAGLMQTLAFYCSKMNDKKHFERLALHIMKWILRADKVENESVDTSRWDDGKAGILKFLRFLLDQSDEKMMMLTAEATEVTQWLARFADARLKEK